MSKNKPILYYVVTKLLLRLLDLSRAYCKSNCKSSILQAYNNHGLILNPIKFAAIVFGPDSFLKQTKNVIDININNTKISLKDEVKNLGLWVDSKFRYK